MGESLQTFRDAWQRMFDNPKPQESTPVKVLPLC